MAKFGEPVPARGMIEFVAREKRDKRVIFRRDDDPPAQHANECLERSILDRER
jgi:hypothetical protein